MKIIEIETELNASADAVWDAVTRPELLIHVAKGMLSFQPIDPPTFPERWSAGEYVVGLLWKGFFPLGRQVIAIEFPEPENGARFVRDNGRSRLIRTWDHLITIAPAPGGRARSVDRLRLDAGSLTPLVAWFAERFYRHRQRRWRDLADTNFNGGGVFDETNP